MKRTLKVFLTIIVSLVLVFNLSSCDFFNKEEHVHSFASGYSYDDEYHFYKCLGNGCDEVIGKELHTPSDWIIKVDPTCTTQGLKIKECTVCHKELERVEVDALGHDLNDASYSWNSDNTSCEASTSCKRSECSYTSRETGVITTTVKREATCTTDEIDIKTAIFVSNHFVTQNKEVTKSNSKLNHNYSTPIYTWSTDKTTCRAVTTCTNAGCSEEITETVNSTSSIKTQATCTTNRIEQYEAIFTNSIFAVKTLDVEIKNSTLNHEYGEVTYTWGENNSLTASVTCTNPSCNHQETETVVAAFKNVKTAASTTSNRIETYEAVFTKDVFGTVTIDKEIEGTMSNHEHVFNAPTYTWSNDSSKCTATRSCTQQGCTEKEEELGSINQTTKVDATCLENKVVTITATFRNTNFVTQNKEVEIENSALNHNYVFDSFVWDLDALSVKVKLACSHDSNHTNLTDVDNVTTNTINATCVQKGYTRYTATYNEHSEYKDVEIAINVNAHELGDASYTWTNFSCTAEVSCANEGCTHKITETVTAVKGETVTEATIEANETANYKATFTNELFSPQTKVFEIEGTKIESGHTHTYGDISYVWSSDYNTCRAYRTCTETSCNHIDEETVNSVETVVITETYTQDRVSDFKATFVKEAFATQEKDTIVLEGTKYKDLYNFVEFVWTDQKAKAKYVSKTDSSLYKEFDASVERTSGSDCTSVASTITLTASFDSNTITKDFESSKKSSHSYQFDHFEWSDDNLSVVAVRYCKVCHKRYTANVTPTSSTLKDATCSTYGLTKYELTYEYSKVEYKDSKTVLTAKNNNHNYGTLHPSVDATSEHNGNIAYYECSACNKYFNSEKVEVTTIVILYSEEGDVNETKGNLVASDTLDYIPTYSYDYDSTITEYQVSDGTTTYDLSKIYDGYYTNFTWTNSEDLLNKLNALISGNGYTALSYEGNWESNTYADTSLYNSDFVNSVYSTFDIYTARTGSGWQREHAWCASLMTGKLTGDAVKTKGRATDFHNLFAAYASGNTSRGNKNFGNVSAQATVVKENDIVQYSYDSLVFEPNDEDKGRLARAIFYMATMYKPVNQDGTAIDGLKGLTIVEGNVEYISGEGCLMQIGHLSDLLEWSLNYVDRSEFQHNEMVYGHEVNGTSQGNRNPFVDFPELVEYAFGSKKNQGGTLNLLVPTYYQLGLDSTDTYCYSIDVNEYQIDEDSVVDGNDFTIYKVSKYTGDFETSIYQYTEVTTYTVTGLNESNKFDTVGENTLTIEVGENEFNINLLYQNHYLQDSYFSVDFTKDMFKDITSGTEKEITINGTTWLVTIDGNTSTPGVNANFGVQFGSGTNPATKITLKSKYNFNCDGKNEIDSINLKGSTASGNSYDLVIKLVDANGNAKASSGTIEFAYNSREIPVEVSLDNIGGLTGHVVIEISDITAAVYLHSLGIDFKE